MKTASPRHNLFLELFPTPRFLEMAAIGLDISDEKVRFAELKRRHGRLELGAYGETALAQGIVEDGFIRDKEALSKALSSLRVKHGLCFANVSLPEEKSYFFKIELPAVDDADLRDAVAFHIEENVPIALKDSVYDQAALRRTDSKVEAGVTVLHRNVTSSYLESVRGAGLEPVSLQVESHALARALVPSDFRDPCIVAMLRAGKTVIAIVFDGHVQFTSTIPIGGEAIVAAIGKELDESAEAVRGTKESRDSNRMFMALVNAASTLRDEVQKLIGYWAKHDDGSGAPIRKIFLAGKDVSLGLDAYLGRSLAVPCVVANPWANVAPLGSYLPPMTLEESLEYAAAIGLALPS